jgi:hypothetical protein
MFTTQGKRAPVGPEPDRWTMPAGSRKEPKRQEYKRGTNPARTWGSTGFRSSTGPAPHWTAKPQFEIAEERSPALIVLFGAVGAVLPIVLLLLGRPDLFGFAVLLWPTAIFMAGVEQPPGHVAASAFLLPVLSNVAIYLLFGSLLWLGLVRPRSVVFLTIGGLLYLTVVGVAAFCELLLR